MKTYAYMTAKSAPIRMKATRTKQALDEADAMGALWVSLAGKIIGKTIDGKWMGR